MKLLIFALVLLSGAYSFAGDEKRDGGIVVACDNSGATTYDVMDLFEGKTLYDLNLQSEKGADYREIFENMMNRLAKMNPGRAGLYRSYMKTWSAETKELEGLELGETRDEGWYALPSNCRRVQAVVQFRRPTVNGVRYYLNKTVWNKLTEIHKAALLIHEFMYREGGLPEQNFTSSSGVRYFNAYLHSDRFTQGGYPEYYKVLSYVGYSTMDIYGVQILLHVMRNGEKIPMPVMFDGEGQLASAYAKEYTFLHGDRWTTLRCENSEVLLLFNKSKRPTQVRGECLMKMAIFGSGYEGFVSGDSVDFDQMGRVSKVKGSPSRETDQVMKLQGPALNLERGLGKIAGEFWVGFYSSGQIESLYMGKRYYDLTKSYYVDGGRMIELSSAEFDTRKPLRFSPEGQVLKQ